ncbi:hypothetical protein LTR53_000816 [Teratosphaeriaceae sp. CCFEE 6253]|nr:hypothetical protein LTR53_000816 [Teratosphaeriaceae sp. CCFEE 6253]
MRSTSLFFISFLAGRALAQVATITAYVTVPSVVKQAATEEASSTLAQTTFATTASNAITSAYLSAASQATSTDAPAASAQPTSDTGGYEGGSSGSGTAVDSDAGASGSGSSFSISKGGLIAIIFVVVLVAIFGIASTILFVVAKRRQWNVRASIRRASRRLTGRSGVPQTPRTPGGRSNRRTTVHAGRLASPRSAKPPAYSKHAIRLEDRDMEKGGQGPSGRGPPESVRVEKPWAKRLWGNDWK